jgi:hypothetical protein
VPTVGFSRSTSHRPTKLSLFPGTLKPGALTKAEVIAALLPTSLDNKKIATKDLISLLKTQIIRDKAGNMDRLKVLIKELCIHATDGVVLKPEYRK